MQAPAYAALSRLIPSSYKELRDEIARTYDLIEQKPRHSKSWLRRQLDDEFLAAAA